MNISVLGCGWLGFPLAQRLISMQFSVKGSTTSEKKIPLLKQNEIEPYLIDFPNSLEDAKLDRFLNSDLVIINIPPGRGSKNYQFDYQEINGEIIKLAKQNSVSWIIFTSSTSVYNKFGGVTKEGDAEYGKASKPSGEILLKTEDLFINSGIDYTILRLGGLYGYGRHPVNYLSGKKDLDGASKPVNLIHQTDCVEIIAEIISQKKRNEIYNVVSDGHPPRKEFYESAASHFNLPPPTFKPNHRKDYKVVSNEKLKSDLYYTFTYPNPMDHTP